jgi:small subunit ribosomal protein S17
MRGQATESAVNTLSGSQETKLTMSEHTKKRKTQQGAVVSNRMDKSVVVLVERNVRHKLYGKYIRRRVKYMAHDESNECNIGDVVLIEECRPLSRNKRWRVRSVVEKAI